MAIYITSIAEKISINYAAKDQKFRDRFLGLAMLRKGFSGYDVIHKRLSD